MHCSDVSVKRSPQHIASFLPNLSMTTPITRIWSHTLLGMLTGIIVGIIDLTLLELTLDAGVSFALNTHTMSITTALLWTLGSNAVWGGMIFLAQSILMTSLRALEHTSSLLPKLGVGLITLCLTYFWHLTALQGDGIRANPYFLPIKFGLWGTLFLVIAATHINALNQKQEDQKLWLFYGILGLTFSLCLLPLYTNFHAYLTAYSIWCLGMFLWPAPSIHSSKSPHTWRASLHTPPKTILFSATCITFTLTTFASYQTHTHTKATLQVNDELLLTRYLNHHAPHTLFDVQDELMLTPATPAQLQQAQHILKAHQQKHTVHGNEHLKQNRKQAQHVVLIVLESINANAWSNPEITPEFSSWKTHGTYFPRAIAHYPATPLAYGSIFLSQPPYVIAQSRYWAQNTPLKHLKTQHKLNNIYLSKPDNHWFQQSAITSFILGKDTEAQTHQNTSEGLTNLRHHLEQVHTTTPVGEHTFSWIHLYDAHAPYEQRTLNRPQKQLPNKERQAYLSEVSHVDLELGKFMRWFFENRLHEDTLLVMIADHGESLGHKIQGKAHWGHHVHVHTSLSEIPLFITGPGVAQNRTITGPVAGQIDIIPTLFDAIGKPLPNTFMAQGQSLFPIIGTHVNNDTWTTQPPRTLSTEAFNIRGQEFFDFVSQKSSNNTNFMLKRGSYSPKIALNINNIKLVYNRSSYRTYLYDLAHDPDETHDLSHTDLATLNNMKLELRKWRDLQHVILDTLENDEGGD